MGLLLLLLRFYKADANWWKTDLLLLKQKQRWPLNNWPLGAYNGPAQRPAAAGVLLSTFEPLQIFPPHHLLQQTARIHLRCCDGIHSVQNSLKNEALCILEEKHTRSCKLRCYE